MNVAKSYDRFDGNSKMFTNHDLPGNQVVQATNRTKEGEQSKHTAIYSSAVEIIQSKQNNKSGTSRDTIKRTSVNNLNQDKDNSYANQDQRAKNVINES